jgi:uncharacterized cofD-like protein
MDTAIALRRAALIGFLAILLLLGGLALSFRLLLLPVVVLFENAFATVASDFISQADLPVARHYAGGAMIIAGGYLLYIAIRGVLREVMRILNPGQAGNIAGTFWKQQVLAAGPNIVALGGGTGLSTLLRGLKSKSSRITAIVTMSDDGGSSGRLIADKKMLPPGDIRNCLVALADSDKLMADLFQHRFEGASGSLSGHSTGNLLIAALMDITGDFDKAIREVSRVLAIRGRVIPVTLDPVCLRAVMENGDEIFGETKIVNSQQRIRHVYLEPPDCQVVPKALDAIQKADVIVLGPGSIYTSVIPPLLVPGIADALANSSALKIYVCNVMTQPGESDHFSASDHVRAIESNVGKRVFDHVLVNKATPGEMIAKKYAASGQEFVVPDTDRIRAMGLKVTAAKLISETDVVRHDPIRVAESVERLWR